MSTENDRPPQRARARRPRARGTVKEGNLWESFIVGCKVMHAKRKRRRRPGRAGGETKGWSAVVGRRLHRRNVERVERCSNSLFNALRVPV